MIRLIKLGWGGVLPQTENRKEGKHWVSLLSESDSTGRGSEA